jgi:hypothetical protein
MTIQSIWKALMGRHQRSIAIGKTTLQRGAKIKNATQVGYLSARMGGLSIWKMNKKSLQR